MHRLALEFKRNFPLNQYLEKITNNLEKQHKTEDKMRKKHANLARHCDREDEEEK